MYQITAYDSPTSTTGHIVFNPMTGDHITDGKLELIESEIDRLTLTVSQKNYLFGNVRPLQTHVEVYQDNILLFRGRALDMTRQMKDSGQFVQSFVFESIQNYLQDTPQYWAKVQNTTPKDFFKRLIDLHNRSTESYKQFTVRNVDVTNSTDNVYRYIEDGATTWDTIKDKLISRLGGYIRVERTNGINYIDYLQNPGKDHPNDTPIQITKNLQSVSVQIDPTEVITQLVPLGATIEDENTDTPDENVSRPRVDIKSVNNNKDYIDIPTLRVEFGRIRKSVTWDDIHEPAILLTRAKQWIAKQAAAKESWTVEALELPQFSSFKVSDSYMFVNPYVASEQLLRVTAKTIDFANPNKSSLTIADKQVALSQYLNENNNATNQVKKLRSLVESYNTRTVSLNREAKEMQSTIKDQQTLINKIEKDVDDADIAGVNNRIGQLTNSTNDLARQLKNLNYATPEQLQEYEKTQNVYNNDFETRLLALENKGDME